MNEKLKILNVAWKIYNSKKYKDSNYLLADDGARSFAGILCTLLKEKLKLEFKKLGDCTYIGQNNFT